MCGARTRFGTLCRHWRLRGSKRCLRHGGKWRSGAHVRSVSRSHTVIRSRQAVFRALGLPWYGGRLPGAAKLVSRIERAVAVADDLIEMLELEESASEHLPAVGIGGRAHSETLHEGSLRGLVLQRDIVVGVQAQLDAVGIASVDVKLLRAGNEAARDLTRLAVRVAEGSFRAQQGLQLVQLLEALKAAQARKGTAD